jgi:predicted transcriptional regulator
MDMAPPQSTKDVQRLTGRLTTLNRFISMSAKRSLPFLKTLHDAKDFVWGLEQATAFESLKQHLSDLATLTSPDYRCTFGPPDLARPKPKKANIV